MALGKLTNDNNVRYFPKSEQIQGRDKKPKTIENKPLSRKQNKNISQNSQNFVKNFATKGFSLIK